MKIKVLLADDHKIIRDGLKSLIAREEDIEIVGEAENGRSAVRLAKKLHPEIVVMDVSMPDMNGIEATKKITEKVPGARVIGLSMYSEKRFISQMFDAGATGYLPKDCAFEELADAIRSVHSNKIYLNLKCGSRKVAKSRNQRSPEAI